MRFEEKEFRLITRYCIVSLLLLVLAGCGGSGNNSNNNEPTGGIPPPPSSIPPPALDLAIHYDGLARITVPYPEQWRRIASAPSGLLMIFDEPLENASDRFDERIELVKVDVGTPTKTNIVVFQQVSTDQIQMAGFTGRETIFDGNMTISPVTALRFMELAFDYAGSTYALNLIAEPDEFDRLADVARYMAQEMVIGTVILDDLSSGSDLSKPGLPAMTNDGDSFLVISCRDLDTSPSTADLIARFVRSDLNAFIAVTNES